MVDVTSAQVCRASQLLDEELEVWRTRPLGEKPYLVLDACYEKVPHGGHIVDVALLIAVGVQADGLIGFVPVAGAMTVTLTTNFSSSFNAFSSKTAQTGFKLRETPLETPLEPFWKSCWKLFGHPFGSLWFPSEILWKPSGIPFGILLRSLWKSLWKPLESI